jgi:hypothetical protein
MSFAVSVVPLFATPFAVVTLPEPSALNAALGPLLARRAGADSPDPAWAKDPACFRSRDSLFESGEEPVRQLRSGLLGALCTAVASVNQYSDEEFNGLALNARARYAIVRPEGHIPAGNVPMASWVGIYCVAAPAAVAARGDSAVLRIYAVRAPTTFLDAANWQLRPPFNAEHHVWRPVPGQMAVFPASVLHEIALNRGTSDLVLVLVNARFGQADQAAGAG